MTKAPVVSRFAKLRSLPLTGILCLLLLFVQATALNHFHEEGLHPQADCEFCLKISPADSTLATSSTEIQHSSGHDTFVERVQSLQLSAAAAPNSRAPPIA